MFDKSFFHLLAGFLAIVVAVFGVIVFLTNYDAVTAPSENTSAAEAALSSDRR